MKRLAVLSLLAVSSAAFAQQHPSFERGFDPAKAYQFSEIDSISLMNGNLALEIPIGASYPITPSFSYGLRLTYNSKAWDHEERGLTVGDDTVVRAMPNRTSNAGMGWSLSLGLLLDPNHGANDSDGWLYLDANGGTHQFYGDLHTNGTGCTGFGTCYSRDSSYLRFRHLNATYKVIEFPSGERHLFERSGVIGEWRVRALGDRWSPQTSEPSSIDDVLVEYLESPIRWRLTDRHGRVQEVEFEAVSQNSYTHRIKQVRLTAPPAASGAARTATWNFGYSATPISVACSNSDSTWTSVTPSFLTTVTQPDGSSWGFSYHLGDDGGGSCHARGVIARVTYPTGGKTEYTWRGVVLPLGGCSQRQYQANSAGVAERRVFAHATATQPTGVTTYSSSLSAPPVASSPRQCASGRQYAPPSEELTVTVVTPLKDQTKHYFSVFPGADFAVFTTLYDKQDIGLPFTRHQPAQGGRLLSSVIYDCADDGTNCVAKREQYVTFERDSSTDCTLVEDPDCPNSNRRLVGERTRYLDDIENPNTNPVTYRYADVARSGFDGLGHYRTETTGGNFGQADTATTFTNWNPGSSSTTTPPLGSPWVLGTYIERRTTEGISTVVQQACFDPATGFLRRIRTLAGTTPQSKDLLTEWTPDVHGQATSERQYGGDLAADAIGTGALCSMALPTQPAYRTDFTYAGGVIQTAEAFTRTGASVGFKSTEQTVHVPSGLVVADKDPSGVATNFQYDVLGRLETLSPEAGADGKTRMTYTQATSTAGPQLQVVQRNAADSADMTRAVYLFDGLGRLVEEQRTMPGSTAKRFTTYDAAGNVASRSVWGTSGAAAVTKYRFYDPFGRPGRAIFPDGKKEVYFYGGVRGRSWQQFIGTSRNAVTGAITEATVNVGEVYDRQGRLWKANEPRLPNLSGDQTVYEYDAAGRLVYVDQGDQERLFTYDGRGFLLSEQHPELGASGDGTVSYSLYDARGNLGRKEEAGVALETVYDDLGRPTKLEQVITGQPRRTWREWTYGTGQTAGDRSAGKLVSATRHNWIVPPWNTVEIDVAVTETLTYGGRAGRVSAKATSLNTGQNFSQSFTWNELGLLQSETYPVCGHATCTGSPGTTVPRTVSYSYLWGQLTNVSGWATIGYHPNGLVASVSHGNGVLDTITNDPFEMARPQKIETTGANLNFKSGDYAYDAAGNIVKIGPDWFLYDPRSRLVASRVDDQPDLPGIDRFQSYLFDRYGNLTETTTQIGTGTPVTRTAPVVFTTNRFSNGLYDAFGNVTSYSAQSYAWDVLRMMKGTPGKILLYGPGDERIWEFAYTSSAASTFRETFSLRGLGGQVLREYKDIGGNSTGNWSLAEEFIYRDGQLLASVTPTQTTHYTLDHLGTPRLATGNAGATLAYHAYFPFGEEATNPGQNAQRMKFTGHQRDNLGGGLTDDLDYMHARYGSPMTGRFLSLDPVLGYPENPQSWNRYGYVLGNPLKLVDRNGRFPWLLFGLAMTGGFFSAEAANAPTGAPNEVLIPNSGGGKQIAGAAILGSLGLVAGVGGAGLSSELAAAFRLAPIARGNVIETLMAGAAGGAGVLPRTFPVIDRFFNGVATSVKSIDLRSASYQNLQKLGSVLRTFVHHLAEFTGGRLGRTVVDSKDITARVLELVVKSPNPEQQKALDELVKFGQQQGIQVTITVVK